MLIRVDGRLSTLSRRRALQRPDVEPLTRVAAPTLRRARPVGNRHDERVTDQRHRAPVKRDGSSDI